MRKTQILGINFYNGDVQGVVDFLKTGGLLVVPSGPGLATIKKDTYYYQSLQEADIIIPDSGYMTLLWNIVHENKLCRISGLEFLKVFFSNKEIIKSSILLVDPNSKESKYNLNYLDHVGFEVSKNSSYIAPIYPLKFVEDYELLKMIEEEKPKYILINLGSGIQEKLGAFLKRNLSYKPGIICTGAAIAFLTGQQANIPTWADKCYLGWLVRCIEKPGLYIPRYAKAFKLASLLLRNGGKTPV